MTGFEDYSHIPAQVGQLNDEIIGQNNSFDYLVASEGEFTYSEFPSLGKDILETEQRNSFDLLVEATAEIDFAGLASAEQTLRHEIVNLELILDSTNLTEANSDSKNIEHDRDKLIEIIPVSAEKSEILASNLLEKVAAQVRAKLEQIALTKKAELQAIEEKVIQAGVAWAIPRIIDPGESVTYFLEDLMDDELIEVDEFPVEEKEKKTGIVDIVRKRYNGRLEDASVHLAAILSEIPKTVFTPIELGEAIYGGTQNDEPDLNSNRVSALVSGFRLGKVAIIGDELTQKGLVFQRGIRTKHKTDGSQVGQAQPIYRAIRPDDKEFRTTIVRAKADGGKERDGKWVTIVFPDQYIDDKGRAGQLPPISSEISELPDELKPFAEDAHRIVGKLFHLRPEIFDDESAVDSEIVRELVDKDSLRTAKRLLRNIGLLPRTSVPMKKALSIEQTVLAMLVQGHSATLKSSSGLRERALNIVNDQIEGCVGMKAAA